MKIKILIVKYVDIAVLGILGIVCAIVLYQAFIGEDTNVEKIRADLTQYEKTVQNAMKSDYTPPFPQRNLIAELSQRFEHLPVIPPFRRDPFISIEDVFVPPVLQLAVGQTQERVLKGTRLIEILPPAERAVDVAISYNSDDETSTVAFTAKAEGSAEVRIQDETEQVYRFEVAVRVRKELPPPNPPVGVMAEARPPLEMQGVRYPPAVLVSFQPNNPVVASAGIGFSNAARIYRKPAEASDLEYRDVSGMIIPASLDESKDILRKFDIQPVAPVAGGPTGPAGGPLVPEAAPAIGSAALNAPQATPYPPNSYMFLDTTVDEGESYIYKIVTFSTGQDAEPTPTANPFVMSTPVAVPALVNFTVASVTDSGATFMLTRNDPDTGQPLPAQRFQAIPGMPIGGIIKVTTYTVGVDGRRLRGYKFVDFSTNCILVDTIMSYPDVQYTVRQDVRTGTTQYSIRERTSSQVLYLTPRGFLRMKEKEARR